MNPLGRAAARAGDGRTAAVNAPLFRSLVHHLDTAGRWVVLDLGAACTETIAVFSRFRCRLDIADIADGLDELRGEQDPLRLSERAESLLPERHAEPTDVVLCWDLPNYLERPALAAFMTRVATRVRPGALVHALIVYSQKNMPARPGHYVPQGDLSLVNTAPPCGEQPAPRYSPEDLERCMRGFYIERAMLLRNGMQEFLLRAYD